MWEGNALSFHFQVPVEFRDQANHVIVLIDLSEGVIELGGL
eukprot:CAMPEP_0185590976 /NCGR_PEP_ID=MMETSP0434-20130131/62890_1 /TAXON_ID=626734 ORGANISM="Favella taraikaensis, Strain Fe Narragansett Bay" /NCGR_SAMPLE_ID=MMETSP0434 /ASSEMBLY_ACC=CAM_ASM_000379 /LENGTH=40 /DNA_ID= /DNA_START= /DNA_END= /DNA_ORIENTATION=